MQRAAGRVPGGLTSGRATRWRVVAVVVRAQLSVFVD